MEYFQKKSQNLLFKVANFKALFLLVVSLFILENTNSATEIVHSVNRQVNAKNKSVKLSRVLISPWSSKENEVLDNSPVLRHIENVLNHLGFYVEYYDLATEELPDPASLDWKNKYAGVLSFFDSEKLKNSKKWTSWLHKFSEQDTGLPWIALGKFGFLGKQSLSENQQLLRKFNLEYYGNEDVALVVKIKNAKQEYLGYEKKLNTLLNSAPYFYSQSAESNNILELHINGAKSKSVPVFVSPKMSVAYDEYGLRTAQSKTAKRQWLLNPFKFFRLALKIEDLRPIPDVNVINGARTYFSHIDGDAANTVSQIDNKKYTSEIMYTDIFLRYPNLPISISFIPAEVSPSYNGNQRLLKIASKILALPNVEPASHTYNHPLFWRKGKLSFYNENNRELKIEREIVDSIKFIQDNLLKDKKIDTIFWSGDCLPEQNAMELLAEHSFFNINGGDGRFDNEFPSIAYLSALGKPFKNNRFQVYTANANDNIYTNSWEGPYYGFRKVIQTFERSGHPKILKAINPYYHFFSAEKKVGMEAIHDSIQWALDREIAPIWTKKYIQSVSAYRNVEVTNLGPREYRISRSKNLHSFRIDNHPGWVPEIVPNSGIWGYGKVKGDLYIYIDPNRTKPIDLKLISEHSLKSLASTGVPEPVANNQTVFLKYIGGVLEKFIDTKKQTKILVAPFTRGPLKLHYPGESPQKISLGNKALKIEKKNNELEINFTPSVKKRWLYIDK